MTGGEEEFGEGVGRGRRGYIAKEEGDVTTP